MRKILSRRELVPELATVRVPVLVEADDYHEFGEWQDVFKKLDAKLRCIEVGFIERATGLSTYLGVIYLGRKPSKETLQALVDAKKFTGEVELN